MNDVALITGASSGLGAEFARIHAGRGGDAVLVARREDRLRALADELEGAGRSIHVIAADLSEEDAPERVVAELDERGVAVEHLINNAGFGGRGLFHERPWADDRAMIQVNVVALTALTRLLLPRSVERGRGRVLNVASTAALVPGPLQAVYYATKAYVRSFSNALHEELRDSPVTVTALLPGATKTEFAAVSDMDETALFKNAHPARPVAEAGYEAMRRGDLEVVAGVSLSQRAQLKAAQLAPRRTVLRQVRKAQEA